MSNDSHYVWASSLIEPLNRLHHKEGVPWYVLGERIGVAESTLRKIATGTRIATTLRVADRIASALDRRDLVEAPITRHQLQLHLVEIGRSGYPFHKRTEANGSG